MRSIISPVIPVLIALSAAACGGDRSTAPRPEAASAAIQTTASGTLALSCDFDQTLSDARLFFASREDPVMHVIYGMQAAYASGGAIAATSKGFDALHEIAVARGSDRQGGTAAAGNTLTKDLLGCMSVGAIPATFDVTAALSSGVYEVRGGTGDNSGAALAYVAAANSRTATSPLWGVEAVSNWSGTFNGAATRFLVYGAPLPVSNFTVETAARSGDVTYTGFDISTIPATPALSFSSGSTATPLRAGICIDQSSGSSPNRLLHGGAATTILALDAPAFCGTVASSGASPAGGSLLASLGRGALALLAPKPAYAAAFGGVGGVLSGLSPFGPVQVNVQALQLVFTQQPSDGKVSAPISPAVQVRVTTAAGTPIAGVAVTLSVVRNNGINADVTGTSTVATNELGLATFADLGVTKPGGYLIRAVGSLGGGVTQTVTSNLFNMKGQ